MSKKGGKKEKIIKVLTEPAASTAINSETLFMMSLQKGELPVIYTHEVRRTNLLFLDKPKYTCLVGYDYLGYRFFSDSELDGLSWKFQQLVIIQASCDDERVQTLIDLFHTAVQKMHIQEWIPSIYLHKEEKDNLEYYTVILDSEKGHFVTLTLHK